MADQYFGYGPLTELMGGYGNPWMVMPPVARDIADNRLADMRARALVSRARRERYRLYLCSRYGVRLRALSMISGRIDMRADAEVPTSIQCEVVSDEGLMDVDWASARIQAAMEIMLEDGSWGEWPLGVFLPSTPSYRTTATGTTLSIEGYDQTVILREDRVLSPVVIPKGERYADAILGQINQAGIYTVLMDDLDAVLPADVTYDMGTSRLEIVNSLLTAVNYQAVFANGAGALICRREYLPYERQVDHLYMDDHLSVLAPELGTDMDAFDVPNVIQAVVSRAEGEPLTAQWINDDPASKLSVANRGRRVVRIDQLADALDEAALTAYVRMEGYKTLAIVGSVSFATAPMPDHGVGDMVFLRIFADKGDGPGASGRYLETGYSMELSPGATMTHTAEKVVIL